MKVVISGGGTGGHIYPAISIARAIEKAYKDVEIIFIGTEKGMENELIPSENYELRKIKVRGFQRKLSKDTFIALKEAVSSLGEVKKLLNEIKPDLVIGTGGYVCGPVVLMAAHKHIPTLIHEQNAFPGVTNKILSRFVDQIAITFEEAEKYFNKPEKVKLVGNPLRHSFFEEGNKDEIACMALAKGKPMVLITGGSRGAKKINESIVSLCKYASDTKEIQIVHMTGKTQYEAVLALFKEKGIDVNAENIKILPYIDNMPAMMKAADIIISRCGAGAIAEITALGKASILIPYPYATDNHQEFNARALEKEGAAVVITENEINEGLLQDQVLKLIRNKNLITGLAENSKKLGKPNAANDIVKMIKDRNMVK